VPNNIAVAALHPSAGVDPFYSNYGEHKVALAAPGTDILSTLPDNNYGYLSGTSMAAAYVSGSAALVVAAKSDITPAALKSVLIYSNTQPENDAIKGILNVNKTIIAANEHDTTPPAAPSNFHLVPLFPSGGRTVEINWIAPGDDDDAGTVADYDLTFVTNAGERIPLRTFINPQPAGSVQTQINLPVPIGQPDGLIELRAFDNAGNSSSATTAVALDVTPNTDPYIVSLSAPSALSTGGQRLALDGDDQYIFYNLPFDVRPNGNFSFVSVSTNGVVHFTSTPPQRMNGLNDDIPSSVEYLTGQPMLAGLWDDLVIDTTKRADAGVYVLQPNADTVIFRWQANTFADGNPINFEIELHRDQDFICRYGEGNENVSPVVGISFGSPSAYVVSSHTREYWEAGPRLNLGNAQTVTFNARQPPPPAVFNFELENYQVSEFSTGVTLTVTRPAVGGAGLPTLGMYSVAYATSGGTATAGSDYTETSGTITFDIGESSKSFTIPITDDGVIEPSETINITLSNPTNGSALGPRFIANITILDNDTYPSSQIQFGTPIYGAAEDSGAAFVTVTRTGDTSSQAIVDYSTYDGTAQ